MPTLLNVEPVWMVYSLLEDKRVIFTTRWLADSWRELQTDPLAWSIEQVQLARGIKP